jgi:hypothetical protein
MFQSNDRNGPAIYFDSPADEIDVKSSRNGKSDQPSGDVPSASKKKQARGRNREPGRYPPPKEGSNEPKFLVLGSAQSRALPPWLPRHSGTKSRRCAASPPPSITILPTESCGANLLINRPESLLGHEQLSPTLPSASIHASSKCSSRAKSFFSKTMQGVLTRTKVVVAWHEAAILRQDLGCYPPSEPELCSQPDNRAP